jgi:hypothetical protein
MGLGKRRRADRAVCSPMRSPGRPPVARREHRQRLWSVRSIGAWPGYYAQQPRSNVPSGTHRCHHAPALLLWWNGLLREGSWWAPLRGSLDGMQGVTAGIGLAVSQPADPVLVAEDRAYCLRV